MTGNPVLLGIPIAVIAGDVSLSLVIEQEQLSECALDGVIRAQANDQDLPQLDLIGLGQEQQV